MPSSCRQDSPKDSSRIKKKPICGFSKPLPVVYRSIVARRAEPPPGYRAVRSSAWQGGFAAGIRHRPAFRLFASPSLGPPPPSFSPLFCFLSPVQKVYTYFGYTYIQRFASAPPFEQRSLAGFCSENRIRFPAFAAYKVGWHRHLYFCTS